MADVQIHVEHENMLKERKLFTSEAPFTNMD